MTIGEDLTVFYTPGTPGVMPAVWNGAATVYCDFIDPYTAAAAGLADGTDPFSSCVAAEVGGIKQGDTWLVNGQLYKIRGAQPEGSGIMLLRLEKQ
jgi:hypothetical protein